MKESGIVPLSFHIRAYGIDWRRDGLEPGVKREVMLPRADWLLRFCFLKILLNGILC